MQKILKILSLLENSPPCSFLLLSSIKIGMIMEKVMTIIMHGMQHY